MQEENEDQEDILSYISQRTQEVRGEGKTTYSGESHPLSSTPDTQMNEEKLKHIVSHVVNQLGDLGK